MNKIQEELTKINPDQFEISIHLVDRSNGEMVYNYNDYVTTGPRDDLSIFDEYSIGYITMFGGPWKFPEVHYNTKREYPKKSVVIEIREKVSEYIVRNFHNITPKVFKYSFYMDYKTHQRFDKSKDEYFEKVKTISIDIPDYYKFLTNLNNFIDRFNLKDKVNRMYPIIVYGFDGGHPEFILNVDKNGEFWIINEFNKIFPVR
jgi:hypothetical protein